MVQSRPPQKSDGRSPSTCHAGSKEAVKSCSTEVKKLCSAMDRPPRPHRGAVSRIYFAGRRLTRKITFDYLSQGGALPASRAPQSPANPVQRATSLPHGGADPCPTKSSVRGVTAGYQPAACRARRISGQAEGRPLNGGLCPEYSRPVSLTAAIRHARSASAVLAMLAPILHHSG